MMKLEFPTTPKNKINLKAEDVRREASKEPDKNKLAIRLNMRPATFKNRLRNSVTLTKAYEKGVAEYAKNN